MCIQLCFTHTYIVTMLTPWELWLVRKTKDRRKRIEKERQDKV